MWDHATVASFSVQLVDLLVALKTHDGIWTKNELAFGLKMSWHLD